MNKLKLINIQRCNKRVKKLYKEAFPINERLPIFILNSLNKEGISDFFEIYEMLCYSKNNLNVDKQEYEALVKHFLGKFLYKIYKKISE